MVSLAGNIRDARESRLHNSKSSGAQRSVAVEFAFNLSYNKTPLTLPFAPFISETPELL